MMRDHLKLKAEALRLAAGHASKQALSSPSRKEDAKTLRYVWFDVAHELADEATSLLEKAKEMEA